MFVTNKEIVVWIYGVMIGAFLTLLITKTIMDVSWQKYLIKKGVAEYYLNEEYERKWRLLIDKKEELK